MFLCVTQTELDNLLDNFKIDNIMCFVTKWSKIRIATKDIVCYKRVIIDENCCFSLHQKFKYEYNKTYSGKSKIKIFFKWFFNENITDEGYHSFIESEVYRTYGLNYWQSRATVKCIIPKGSLYLIDYLSEEYCSSSIIIKEKLEFKNLIGEKLEKLEEKLYESIKPEENKITTSNDDNCDKEYREEAI